MLLVSDVAARVASYRRQEFGARSTEKPGYVGLIAEATLAA